eukprot:TRINITY_DN284_c0_g1_i1.p1 TRINITY_DN284_c0_g1~~TRINITY_DN284_c0_g1_i1.p1  ORF type:complete len:210 (-),score=55.03 TRINITY_DN284_c0_g1_i1:653-1282(-)
MRTTLVVFAVLLCLGSAMAKPAQSGQSCTMCQFVANYAEDFLESNATETQIINFVASVCNLFPGAFKQQCHDFIAQEGQSLIQLLLQKETPSVICAQLGLCSSAKLYKPAQSGQYCTICEFVVQAAEGYIQSNATLKEIETLLDSVCSILPGGFQDQCADFIDNYLELAIQWILSNENPDVFCTQVGLCSSSAKFAGIAAALKSNVKIN